MYGTADQNISFSFTLQMRSFDDTTPNPPTTVQASSPTNARKYN